MAKATNPWTAFWKKNGQKLKSINVTTIEKSEIDSLLLAHEVLNSLSVDWVPVWKRQNAAYWLLARLGAIEVQGTFHWDKFKPKRKPHSLIVAVEFTGDYMPEEIHEKALAAGMVHQNFRLVNRDVATFGHFVHAVRRGPFATGLLALPEEQFLVVASRICAGQPDLPTTVARVALLRHFEDYCCPIDGLCYEYDEAEVFQAPQASNVDEFSEPRSPKEWQWIFSEEPSRKGTPISPSTYRRWVAEGKINVKVITGQQVKVQFRCIPETVRHSEDARNNVVAKFA